MIQLEELRGKVALVTGAGSGLGKATALALAQEGCQVACVDVDAAAAADVGGKASDGGVDCVDIPCDVTDERGIHAAVETVTRRFGRIDFVVNAAAIDRTVSIEELSIDEWDRIIATNLRGPFVMAKTVIPCMRRQGGGHIVNVASTASVRAWANASAYHASKWGLLGFSRALGVEGREDGIRCTTIIPGGMKTRFFDHFVEDGIPMPDEANLQDPGNVAEVIVFALKMPRETALQEAIVTPMNETSWP